jgi:hypothetical protein
MSDAVQVNPASLPPEVRQRLTRMVRRVRRLIWSRGLLAALAVLLAGSLVVMGIDAVVPIYSRTVRFALSGLAALAALATAWRALARPLSRRLTLTRMARVLETRHPELQERISSAIELLSLGGDAAERGSEQLVALLAQDAEADIRGVQPRQEFAGRTLKPVVSAALIAAGVFAVLLIAWPRQTWLLFTRAVAPYIEAGNLQALDLAVFPGDVTLLRGQPLAVRLTVPGGGDDTAEIRRRAAGEPETVERLKRVSADLRSATYEILFPSVADSFRYRLRYGNGLTRHFAVTVLPPPAAEQCTVSLAPPAYTRLPARVLPEGEYAIAGLASTRVQVTARFNRPANAWLLLGNRRVPGAPQPDRSGCAWTFALATNVADRWALALRDDNGFTNALAWNLLDVRADAPPSIRLYEPAADRLTIPPHERIELAATITEDLGLSATGLVVRLEPVGGERMHALRLEPESRGAWNAAGTLDLASMRLDGVRELRVWVTARDNLPPEFGGPQIARSRTVTLVLDRQAESLDAQQRKLTRQEIQAAIEAAVRELTAAAEGMRGLRPEMARPDIELSESTVNRLRAGPLAHGASAERELQQVATRADAGEFAAVAQAARATVQESVGPARRMSEAVPLAEPGARPGRADDAVQALTAAADRTRGLLALLAAEDAAREAAQKLADLAQRENQLASAVEDKARDRAELEAWQREQERLAREMAAAMAANPTNTQQALVELAAELRREAAEARRLAGEQEQFKTVTVGLGSAAVPPDTAKRLGELARAADNREAAARQSLVSAGRAAAAAALEAARTVERAADKAGEAAEIGRDRADRRARERIDEALALAGSADAQARKAASDAGDAAALARDERQPGAADAAGRIAAAAARIARADAALRAAVECAAKAPDQPADARKAAMEQAAAQIANASETSRAAARDVRQALQEIEPLGQSYEVLYTRAGEDALRTARAVERAAGLAADDAKAAGQVAARMPAQPASDREKAADDLRERAAHAARQAREAAADAVDAAAEAGRIRSSAAREAAGLAGRAAAAVETAADRLRRVAALVDPPGSQTADQLAERGRLAATNAADAARLAAQANDLARQAATRAAEPAPADPAQTIGWLQERLGHSAERLRSDVNESLVVLQALKPAGPSPDAARSAVDQATRMAGDAGRRLDERQPREVVPRQIEAARQFHLAAAALEQLAAQIAPPQAASTPAGMQPEPLRDALQDAAAAAAAAQEARKALDQTPAAEQAEAQAADMAANAANHAQTAGEKAEAAARAAGEMVDQAPAVRQAEDAARAAAAAARTAEKAGLLANEAAQMQKAGQQAQDATTAQNAAQNAEAAARAAAEAAKAVAAAADQLAGAAQQAAQPDQDDKARLQQADNAVKAAAEGADKALDRAAAAQTGAQAAGRQDVEDVADRAREAAAMAQKAGAMATDASRMAREAEPAAPGEHERGMQAAADRAAEAAAMARQAAQLAGDADKEATQAAQAAQQQSQRAAQQAGNPEQVKQRAAEAAAMAQQAARQAQEAAQAAAGASQKAPPGTAAAASASQSAEAAQLAGQSAELSQRAAGRVQTGGADETRPAPARQETGQAIEEAQTATQLARQAAELAQQAARAAMQEFNATAHQVAADAAQAAQEAQQAAADATQAAQAAGPAATQETADMIAQLQEAADLAGRAAGQAKAVAQTAAGTPVPGEQALAAAGAQADQAAAWAQEAQALARSSAAMAQGMQASSPEAQQAADAARSASQQLSAAAQQAAAQASAQAQAAAAQQAAAWRRDSVPTSGGQVRQDESHNLGERNVLPAELAALGFPDATWARFQGAEDAEALEEMLKSVPAEYRDLVRRYFTEIAREAAREEKDQPVSVQPPSRATRPARRR